MSAPKARGCAAEDGWGSDGIAAVFCFAVWKHPAYILEGLRFCIVEYLEVREWSDTMLDGSVLLAFGAQTAPWPRTLCILTIQRPAAYLLLTSLNVIYAAYLRHHHVVAFAFT